MTDPNPDGTPDRDTPSTDLTRLAISLVMFAASLIAVYFTATGSGHNIASTICVGLVLAGSRVILDSYPTGDPT